MEITDNTIQQCGSLGLIMQTEQLGALVSGNVISSCGLGGARLSTFFVGGRVRVLNNSVSNCSASGLVIRVDPNYGPSYQVENNIGYGNAEYGMNWVIEGGKAWGGDQAACNDWFGNGL